jgi:hypothetical protein
MGTSIQKKMERLSPPGSLPVAIPSPMGVDMEFTMFPKPPWAVGFRFHFLAMQALTDQPCHLLV